MRAVILLGLGMTVGCGSSSSSNDNYPPVNCATVTDADTFTVGLEKMGAGGALDFKLMSVSPAPPAVDDNTWVVQINSMASGVVGGPMDGLTLNVTSLMPAHGHNSPLPVNVTPVAGMSGQYNLAQVFYSMPGVWETTIFAAVGNTSDSAMYRFCLPE